MSVACFVMTFVFRKEIEGVFVFEVYGFGYGLGFIGFPKKGVMVHIPGLEFVVEGLGFMSLSVFWVWFRFGFLRDS